MNDDVNRRSIAGELYAAVLGGDIDRVKKAIQDDPIAVYEKNEVGHTPLMLSGATERPDLAKLLLAAGARTSDVTSNNGYGVLHWSLNHPPIDEVQLVETIRELVDHGADVNATGFTGITPLMIAAWFGSSKAVSLLLKRGANPRAKDEKGRTAKEMAYQQHNTQIVDLIENQHD